VAAVRVSFSDSRFVSIFKWCTNAKSIITVIPT
jgi:hypothetical protein